MTALLIAIIIALVITACQVTSAKANENTMKKATRTNVELQKQVTQEWWDKLAPELDVVIQDASVYHYIDTLYDKYGMPKYYYLSLSQDGIMAEYKKDKERSDRDERDSERTRIDRYNIAAFYSRSINGVKCSPELSDDEKRRRHSIYIEKAKQTPRWYLRSMCSAKNNPEKDFRIAFGNDYPVLPPDIPAVLYNKNRTVRQRIFEKSLETFPDDPYDHVRTTNQTAKSYLDHLVYELTQKTMSEKGFAMSRDGIHESDWQEHEKKMQQFKENKEKYPWKFR